MKYLFYNCQLLLLWCVCCKFAIQFKLLCRRIHTQYKQPFATITDGYTNRMVPVSISQRVAKKLRHFAAITDGYTDGMVPVGISHRVGKQLWHFATITDGYTDAFTDRRRTFQSTCLSDCLSVGTVTDGFADERGESDAPVVWRTLTDGCRKIWRDFQKFWCEIIYILTEFNATAQKNIILCSVGNSIKNIVV